MVGCRRLPAEVLSVLHLVDSWLCNGVPCRPTTPAAWSSVVSVRRLAQLHDCSVGAALGADFSFPSQLCPCQRLPIFYRSCTQPNFGDVSSARGTRHRARCRSIPSSHDTATRSGACEPPRERRPGPARGTQRGEHGSCLASMEAPFQFVPPLPPCARRLFRLALHPPMAGSSIESS